MILIDSDNAMGSRRGDVDDAFAIAALVRSGLPIAALGAVAGNTSEPLAFENNRRLCALLEAPIPLLRGFEAREMASAFDGRIAALGPLTNVCEARRAREIVLVGGNLTSRGRWPPVWPHEFNLTKDAEAARKTFALDVPLTIFPLDVCRQLWVHERDLAALGGEFGTYARAESWRWFRHLLLVRQTRRFAIYDLAAAMYMIDGRGFTMQTMRAAMRRNTWIDWSAREGRDVNVCVGIDRSAVWERFIGGVTPPGQPAKTPALR